MRLRAGTSGKDSWVSGDLPVKNSGTLPVSTSSGHCFLDWVMYSLPGLAAVVSLKTPRRRKLLSTSGGLQMNSAQGLGPACISFDADLSMEGWTLPCYPRLQPGIRDNLLF